MPKIRRRGRQRVLRSHGCLEPKQVAYAARRVRQVQPCQKKTKSIIKSPKTRYEYVPKYSKHFESEKGESCRTHSQKLELCIYHSLSRGVQANEEINPLADGTLAHPAAGSFGTTNTLFVVIAPFAEVQSKHLAVFWDRHVERIYEPALLLRLKRVRKPHLQSFKHSFYALHNPNPPDVLGVRAENKIGQNEMLNAVQPDVITGGEV